MKIILTYRILTEEPGSYIVVCENYPLITAHSNCVNRCVDAAKNKTEAVIRTCKEDIIRSYKSFKKTLDAWHFQLLYNLEEERCEKIIGSQDYSLQ